MVVKRYQSKQEGYNISSILLMPSDKARWFGGKLGVIWKAIFPKMHMCVYAVEVHMC